MNSWESGKRRAEHQRAPGLEQALEIVNTHLARAYGGLRRPLDPVQRTVFILGCARSGSTLLLQTLAYSGMFAYPSNIISRFHADPYIGALIHRILLDLDPRHEILPEGSSQIGFDSILGRSKGPNAPHDYAYLWRGHFQFGHTQDQLLNMATIDRAKLRSDIAGLEHVFDRPVMMKAMQMNWHIGLLYEIFPDGLFLVTRRNIMQNAWSLLRARVTYTGSEDHWYSFRPPEYELIKGMPNWEQTIAQVWTTQKAIELGCTNLPEGSVLPVAYDDLCQRPGALLEELQERLGTNVVQQRELMEVKVSSIPSDLVDRATSMLAELDSGVPLDEVVGRRRSDK